MAAELEDITPESDGAIAASAGVNIDGADTCAPVPADVEASLAMAMAHRDLITRLGLRLLNKAAETDAVVN